jgi:dephospho-CoA kinase
MDLSRVLWIGGGQGSGKSSIAWELSRRHGLQLYNIDHRMQGHLARHRRHEFFDLSLDERWLDADVHTMLRWFVETSRDRLRIVLEDVAALPDVPAVIVEGPQLFPSLIAPLLRAPDQALLVVVREDDQRARLAARGPMAGASDPVRARANSIERDLLITSRIAHEAAAYGLAAVVVDAPLEVMIERAESHFAHALERLPRGGDLAAARRAENDAIAVQVRLYRDAGLPARDYPPLVFSCECGEPGCRDTFELSLAEYEALSAAGDRSPLRRPRP